MSLHYLNTTAAATGPTGKEGIFTFSVPAPTDIWRKPPSHDVFNAPVVYQAIPVKNFARARVTISGDWKTQYDQGGLVLVLPGNAKGGGIPGGEGQPKRWIKAGVEFYQGSPSLSVVAADQWADWSLIPLSAEDTQNGQVTIEFERETEEGPGGSSGDKGTTVLKAYYVTVGSGGGSEEKQVVREVTWAFHDLDEDEDLWVGVYAARPTKDEREILEVKLKDFSVDRM